jgi:RNA polymerase, sigma 28 subunit, SigD/FliA/WhiG
LVEQGIMGLINAYLNYNPDKSVKFETYASIRIRGEILDYLRSKDWMPRNLRKKLRIYQK